MRCFRALTIYLSPVLPATAERVARELFGMDRPFVWGDLREAAERVAPFKHLMTRVEGKQLDALFEPPATEQPVPPGGSAIGASISIDDFVKIDLRIAKIVDASEVDGSDKLLKLTLDAGEGRHRVVFSGIKASYAPQDLVGRHTVLVANLAPRKMKFGLSEGMVLAASHADEKAHPGIYLLDPDSGAQPGMRVKLPPVPRRHGAGAAGRRRLRLHGGLGTDGAVVLLPRHHRPRIPEIRRAGFLYLLIAHVGAVAHPALLRRAAGRAGGDYTFDAMRAATDALLGRRRLPARAVRLRRQGGPGAAARLAAGGAPGRALAGVRADERGDAEDRHLRPAARHLRPAALQSGWWGVLALALGLVTALYGVIFAAVQSDMKRLLAWSSIENIGIMLAGFGLTLIFAPTASRAGGADADRAALPRAQPRVLQEPAVPRHRRCCTPPASATWGAGRADALHALDRLAALIGALAIAGLPPLNGFVSEWLLLQAFLLTPGLPSPISTC
jgi:methionine--tRNA ligase beta chain